MGVWGSGFRVWGLGLSSLQTITNNGESNRKEDGKLNGNCGHMRVKITRRIAKFMVPYSLWNDGLGYRIEMILVVFAAASDVSHRGSNPQEAHSESSMS